MQDLNKELLDNEKTSKKSINTKKIVKNVVVTTLVGSIFLGVGFSYGKNVGRQLPATYKAYNDNKTIATVGDKQIKEKYLRQRMDALFYIKGKEKMSEEEIDAFENSMIDYLTTTEVLYLEGEKEGIKVTEDEIDKEYENIMLSINQTFSITEDDIINKLKIPEKDIKESIKKELIASEYIAKASEVSEEDVKKYYEEHKEDFLTVKASHILFETTDENGEKLSEEKIKEVKNKAQNILEQAKSGVDFSYLAKTYSDDTSAQNGGDLGFFMKGQMVEPFEKAAYGLKVGEITTDLVETDYGYHIIKKTDEKYEDFDTVKEELAYTLEYEKQHEKLDELIKKYNVNVKN